MNAHSKTPTNLMLTIELCSRDKLFMIVITASVGHFAMPTGLPTQTRRP